MKTYAIFIKKGSRNGAKRRPMESKITLVLAPWTPQDAKHIQRPQKTQKYIKKLMDRKINVYLDAKEAVELGIADEIV